MKKKKLLTKSSLSTSSTRIWMTPLKNILGAVTNFMGDFGAVFTVRWTSLLLYVELKLNPIRSGRLEKSHEKVRNDISRDK